MHRCSGVANVANMCMCRGMVFTCFSSAAASASAIFPHPSPHAILRSSQHVPASHGVSLSLSPSLSIMGWHPKLQTRWSPTAVEKRSHTTPRVCNAVKHIIRFTKPRPWQCARLPQRGNRRAAALAGGVWMCRGESVLLLWQSIY